MNSTTFDIIIALSMVALPAVLIVWFLKDLASGSEKRLAHMMKRVGLELVTTSIDGQPTETAITAVRARCRRCPSEGLCERWLSGEVSGENTFCPNVLAFNQLMQTTQSAA